WSKSEKLYRRSFDLSGGYAKSRRPLETISPLERHDWLDGLAHHRLADYLRHRAQVRWIHSYDDHPDLTADEGLYAAERMSLSGDDADRQGARRWRITKRLVDLRYSASATTEHGASPRNCPSLRFPRPASYSTTGSALYRREPDPGPPPARCLP